MGGPVLVTGSAGCIGRAVVKELLANGLTVRGFDRLPTPGLADSVTGDLTDGPALLRAAQSMTTLIHLAATPDDDDFLTRLLPSNIVGVYHVFEAARQAGVKRLILASTGQVTWYQRIRGPLPVHVTDPPTPRYWYAAGKVFMEAAGSAYADAHGITVVAVRLGWCPRNPEQIAEIAASEFAQDNYLSPGDAGRFFARATLAPLSVPFAVVFATSKPVRTMLMDLTPARDLLGYEPQDTWPQGIALDPAAG